jgi:hypothetical protein
MNGNFTRINLQDGGRRLMVEGWLVWDAGDNGATLTITVTQGSLTVTADPVQVAVGDDKWEAPIDLNGTQFVKGTAAGIAGATVQSDSGSSSQSWSSSPLEVK